MCRAEEWIHRELDRAKDIQRSEDGVYHPEGLKEEAFFLCGGPVACCHKRLKAISQFIED